VPSRDPLLIDLPSRINFPQILFRNKERKKGREKKFTTEVATPARIRPKSLIQHTADCHSSVPSGKVFCKVSKGAWGKLVSPGNFSHRLKVRLQNCTTPHKKWSPRPDTNHFFTHLLPLLFFTTTINTTSCRQRYERQVDVNASCQRVIRTPPCQQHPPQQQTPHEIGNEVSLTTRLVPRAPQNAEPRLQSKRLTLRLH
jgi:hypothetical protein